MNVIINAFENEKRQSLKENFNYQILNLNIALL